MLIIKNSDLLKITKIKPWTIYFKYEDRYFFIHGNSELGEGSWQTLYERKYIMKDYYILEELVSKNGLTEYVGNFYFKDFTFGKGKTYKNLNVDNFIKNLTFYDFIESHYSSDISDIKNKILIKENEIKHLKEQENILRNEINKLKMF